MAVNRRQSGGLAAILPPSAANCRDLGGELPKGLRAGFGGWQLFRVKAGGLWWPLWRPTPPQWGVLAVYAATVGGLRRHLWRSTPPPWGVLAVYTATGSRARDPCEGV